MDNPVIFQILLALVAIFFMFLTYMNTKTWRWLHVTMTFLVFLAIIPFGVYAALVRMLFPTTWADLRLLVGSMAPARLRRGR